MAAINAAEPVIDIHQHTYYHERSDADLLAHQRGMGVTRTVLLPAGSQYGLAAECGANEAVAAMARRYPREFAVFANEQPDLPETRDVLQRHLRRGAIGVGEQKFPVPVNSPAIDLVASIAREHRVPVLLHFEHEAYNTGFEEFEQVLKRHPLTVFIGHAQTWWANISRDADQTVLYPKGPVTPGGLTDRWLSDYPNLYGDLSAGSGLNAILRDEDHAREFFQRHQDRLLFGTDCADSAPGSERCSGTQMLRAVRRLCEPAVQRKLLYTNAARLLRLD
jgi:predicted TIM-barrel fold metal-dependent hydrolase